MATINFDRQDLIGGNLSYIWSPLANTDSGEPAAHAASADRTVQVTGTFGVGGTVVIEGSLDGVSYFTLHDTQGYVLSFTSAGLRVLLENCVYIRPRVTAGDGSTSIKAIVNVRR